MDEQHGHGDFSVGFVCLFCGGEVEEGSPEFCELSADAEAAFAVFTCHVRCLRERAHAPSRFPALDRPPEDEPPRELPDVEFLAAWERLDDVLGQVHEAELDDVDQVRSLARAVEEAALQHGVAIEHVPAEDA